MVTTTNPSAAPGVDETLQLPLEGLADASIRLAFGGGELAIHPAEPGMLVSGTFEGGVIWHAPRPGSIEIEPDMYRGRFVLGGPRRWNVGITAEIPVSLRLEVGANRSSLDLSQLRIPELELQTGASETTVRMPAAGQTKVRVACGLASVNVEIPDGVAARIRGRMFFGGTDIDERRFPRSTGGWESPHYADATNRVEIVIDGALGSVRVA